MLGYITMTRIHLSNCKTLIHKYKATDKYCCGDHLILPLNTQLFLVRTSSKGGPVEIVRIPDVV